MDALFDLKNCCDLPLHDEFFADNIYEEGITEAEWLVHKAVGSN
jgi:hypothetical protein